MSGIQDRLLTFEIGTSLYAVPIDGVHEVAETAELACVPTLPRDLAGVINYRGDALPVVCRERLLESCADAPRADGEPEHVLVISEQPGAAPCIGLSVDRVLGLVEGTRALARGIDPVAERRPLDDRMAHVLDPARLVARAREVIESSFARGE